MGIMGSACRACGLGVIVCVLGLLRPPWTHVARMASSVSTWTFQSNSALVPLEYLRHRNEARLHESSGTLGVVWSRSPTMETRGFGLRADFGGRALGKPVKQEQQQLG